MKKMKIKIAIILFAIISTVWLCMDLVDDKAMFTPDEPLDVTLTLPRHAGATLEDMIIQYSIDNGINYETSLRIAMCESKM